MTTHPRLDQLEDYSFGRLAETDLASFEEHLLVCEPCQSYVTLEDELRDGIVHAHSLRGRIAKGFGHTRPLKFVHDTSDGPIFSEVRREGKGEWFARHWGQQLDGGKTTRTLWQANAYLLDSFVQMFPEHRCTERCEIIR